MNDQVRDVYIYLLISQIAFREINAPLSVTSINVIDVKCSTVAYS